MQLSPSQVIVLATPVFLAAVALEFAWGRLRGRDTYRLNDAINSISLGMLSEASGALLAFFRIGIYTALAGHIALWRNDAFWLSPGGWLAALLLYDFCYYWQHRTGHRVALFWAAHVVHHQSQEYNLSTALRQPSTYPFLNWVFYVPMALAGVPPLVFGVVALADLLYQFWVHTEHVGRLGWFDRWFCSPSNHRVHHAVNDEYLDRNFGGILIVWDRLFGTFREEGTKCVYGTRAPLESWDPMWANLEVFSGLAKDSWHARSWSDKLRVWFKPPGWRPADVEARFPKAPFALERVTRYHPSMARSTAVFAALQFLALLGAASVFLWNADQLPLASAVVWLVVLAVMLWGIGAVMQGRITVLEALLLDAAALATATSAEGWIELHRVFKPLAMALAIAFVASRPGWLRVQRGFDLKLLAALLLCLAGDVCLMLPDLFIPGLVSFLLAHLCYLAVFKQGQRWFASGAALAGTLAAAVGMYAILFPHLDPVLKVAVACYALVIALMAAQAIGRTLVVRDGASLGVAIGAGFFMASDALLAIDRFAMPIPMAPVLVLGTYYAAQVLIVRNARVSEESSVGFGASLPHHHPTSASV